MSRGEYTDIPFMFANEAYGRADVAKCCAHKCPIAYKCYRMQAKSQENQTWFVGDIDDNCEYFIATYEQNMDGIWMEVK